MNENPFENKSSQLQKPDALVQKNREALDIKVRIATPDDWQALKKIRLAAIDSEDVKMFGPKLVAKDRARTDEQWKEELSPDNKDLFYVLASEGSEIKGMGRSSYYSDEDAWYISSAWTEKDFRGRVFPRTALSLFKDEIKKRGGSKVIIGVKSNNTRSMSLYKALGFKLTSTSVLAKFGKILGLGWQTMELDLGK